jgi:hypothetical protein
MLRRFCTTVSPSAPTEQLGGLRSAALGFLSVCAVDRNLETRRYRDELRDRSGRNPKCACMGSESALNSDVQAPVLALVPESPDVAWQRLDQHCVPQDRIIRVLWIGVELHPDSASAVIHRVAKRKRRRIEMFKQRSQIERRDQFQIDVQESCSL